MTPSEFWLFPPALPVIQALRHAFTTVWSTPQGKGRQRLELKTTEPISVRRLAASISFDSRKRERPEGSCTTYLFDQGLVKILKKVGEECAETIIAAKNEDRAALVQESSDLLYHLLVLLVNRGLTLEEVGDELVSRRRKGSK